MNLFDPTEIRRNLALVHQIIIASEPLMELAYSESKDEQYRAYLLEHLKEERNHAKWLLEDLEGHTEPWDWISVNAAGSQYYLIKHVHPACLLGYMQALERPMSMELIESLERVHGKSLLRTARIHAEEDPKHHAELLRQIEMQPPEIRTLIAQNAAWTADNIARMNHA